MINQWQDDRGGRVSRIGRELEQQIETAQELGQVCFLNSRDLCLRIAPHQSPHGAVRAALGFGEDIGDLSISFEPNPDAILQASSNSLNDSPGLAPEVVAAFYERISLPEIQNFDSFRMFVVQELGFIDIGGWDDLVRAVPTPIPESFQQAVLVPLLQMGELGVVCGTVEEVLKSSGWTQAAIDAKYDPQVREVRYAAFRFQEMTGFKVATIENGDQLLQALRILGEDPFNPGEKNPDAPADRSEAVLAFIKGQPLEGVSAQTFGAIIAPCMRFLTSEHLQQAATEIVSRGWTPLFPRRANLGEGAA